jgi:hypothetical protein
MGEVISVERKIFGKNSFTNVVDVEFKQLVPADTPSDTVEDATVEKFFDDYDSLFYEIPPSGSNISHQELINRSSEYLGISIEDLEDENRQLREETVSLKKQLFMLSNS